MTTKDTLYQQMIAAMKAHDAEKVGALRYLFSQFKYQEINLRRPLNSDEEIKLLQFEVKKRQESIAAYQKGGRPELAQKEQKELAIIEEFLPKQFSDEEVKKVISQIISSGTSDFGSVMKQTMSRVNGLADGGRVSSMVKSLIN